jgi:hypothetical protein
MIIPEVFDALDRAVRSNAQRRRAPRWRRPQALVLVFSVVTAGTALAATSWLPQVGDDQRGHPALSSSPVPADQATALAVLRRAQTEADRGPQVEQVLRLLGSQVDGVLAHGIRLLAARDDGAIVLVPVQRRTVPGANGSTERDLLCVEYLTGLGAASPPASNTSPHPPRPGEPTTTVTGHLIEPSSTQSSPPDAATTAPPSPPPDAATTAPQSPPLDAATTAPATDGSVASSCGDTSDLRQGHITGGASRGDGQFHIYGLVPDGVERVVVKLADGTTQVATVQSNAYDIRVEGPEAVPATQTRLLNADGEDITP